MQHPQMQLAEGEHCSGTHSRPYTQQRPGYHPAHTIVTHNTSKHTSSGVASTVRTATTRLCSSSVASRRLRWTSVTAEASLTHFQPTPRSGLRPQTPPVCADGWGTAAFHLCSDASAAAAVACWPCAGAVLALSGVTLLPGPACICTRKVLCIG